MKTLYLHMGTPKTATTSIQWFCTDNAEALEKHGVIYPILPFRFGERNWHRNGCFLSTMCYTEDKKRDKKTEAENFDAGMEIVHSLFKTHDNIILSDESLWTNVYRNRTDVLPKLMKCGEEHGYQIKAIIYLRRQDAFIDSYWNQYIKEHANVGKARYCFRFDEFYRVHAKYAHLDYYQAVEKIAAVIGEENLTIRSFDRVVKEKMIQEDFLNYLGLEMTDEYVITEEIRHRNTRLYGNTAEIKRVANSLDTASMEDNKFIEYTLIECAETSRKAYKCDMMSTQETAEFMKQYEEDNQKLADKYIGDGKPLFSLNYEKKKPKWTRDNEHFIDDVINFSAVGDIHIYRMLAEQGEEIKRLLKELERLNRREAALKYYLKHPIKGFFKVVSKIFGKKNPAA